MSGVVNKLFDKSGSNAYNTPDRKMRFTDVIYGSNAS